MSVLHLTKDDFDTTIASGTAIVDFWAEWCMPCRMVTPIIERLADKLDGKVAVAKVDVDAQGELALRFGIRSIPTVIVFKNGKEIGKLIGANTEADYEALIEKAESEN